LTWFQEVHESFTTAWGKVLNQGKEGLFPSVVHTLMCLVAQSHRIKDNALFQQGQSLSMGAQVNVSILASTWVDW
jgi:hypothetical protein